jgi:hypothetical protein
VRARIVYAVTHTRIKFGLANGFLALTNGFSALTDCFPAGSSGPNQRFLALINGFLAPENGFPALVNGFPALLKGFLALVQARFVYAVTELQFAGLFGKRY